MVGCAASKRAAHAGGRRTLAVGVERWRERGKAPEPLPHDGAVPGLLLFRRRRVVRGLVRGCHGVDRHYVDEAVDFVNDTLVARFLRPVEATHCLLVCAALNEDCVCRREAKLDFLARLGVLVNVLVVVVHDHVPFFHALVSCDASSVAYGLAACLRERGPYVVKPFDHACLGADAHLVVVAVQLVVRVNCVAGVPFAQCDNSAALVGGGQCGRVKALGHARLCGDVPGLSRFLSPRCGVRMLLVRGGGILVEGVTCRCFSSL